MNKYESGISFIQRSVEIKQLIDKYVLFNSVLKPLIIYLCYRKQYGCFTLLNEFDILSTTNENGFGTTFSKTNNLRK